MKLDQVITALQDIKGDGGWRVIAVQSGIHYDTLARIARRRIKSPSAQIVEKIADAIASLQSERRDPVLRQAAPHPEPTHAQGV